MKIKLIKLSKKGKDFNNIMIITYNYKKNSEKKIIFILRKNNLKEMMIYGLGSLC